MINKIGLVLIVIYCFSAPAAAERLIKSPATRVSLLELYTSEGCSSCPPADEWLSSLKRDKRLWTSLVPIAFHVDYWDYIGWKDRFASPQYSDRQRRYAISKNLSTVYTPGFLMNGEEWRSFFGLRRLSLDQESAAGVLSLHLDGTNVKARYLAGNHQRADLILNLALLGFDISTEVRAGENHGRTLTHNFVVLGHKTTALTQANESYDAATTLPESDIDAGQYGLAAWVHGARDLTPIQAAGGYLN